MKTVVVALPADEYQRLAARAEASDRDPHQEARHLVRQGIDQHTGDFAQAVAAIDNVAAFQRAAAAAEAAAPERLAEAVRLAGLPHMKETTDDDR